VARSYFSRVLEGSHRAALAPPRPVSSLWKTAHIARLGQSADSDLSSERNLPAMRNDQSRNGQDSPRDAQRARAMQTPPAAPNVTAPGTAPAEALVPRKSVPLDRVRNSDSVAASPAAAVSKTVATRSPGARKAATEDSKPVIRPADRQREPRATELLPKPTSRRDSHTSQPPASSPQSIAGSSDVLQGAVSNEIKRPASPQHASEPAVRVSRSNRQPDRANGNALREAISADARAEIVRRFSVRLKPEPQLTAKQAAPPITADPITVNRPTSALIEPVLPIQTPEPPPRAQRSTAAVPPREAQRIREAYPSPEAPRTTVQIGKIEVQVVPPMTTVRLAAPVAQPKQRLARGYALWPGR
jgi:hypothetical protein